MHWYRLSVDVDSDGKLIGMSYEVRREERIEAIHVLSMPAPNESAHDALEAILTHLENRYGVWLPLF